MKFAVCPKCENESEDTNKSTWARDLLTRQKICALCADNQAEESASLEDAYMRFEAPTAQRDAYVAKQDAAVARMQAATKPTPAPLCFDSARNALDFADKHDMRPAGFVQDTRTQKWVILFDGWPLSGKPFVLFNDGTHKPIDGQPIQFSVSVG